MPKLKISDEDLDIAELEDAEYNDDDFATYDGEQPPPGTILSGRVRKAWWGYTQANQDPMIKVIWEAECNTGTKSEFDGLPVWDMIVLKASTKFRWKPFLDVMGLTLSDVKGKLYVEDEDDNVGAPIEKIAKWVPGSDDALCRIVTKREKYEGQWTTKVGKWLDPEDAEPDDDEDEDEAPPPPRRGRRPAPAPEPEPEDDDEPDDDEFEDDEDEPEPPPARRRRAPAAPAAPAKPARPAARASRQAAPAAPARRGRRQAVQDTEDLDPPF